MIWMYLFGADEGTCAFSGAPRSTAHRAVEFAFFLFCLPTSSTQTNRSRDSLHPQVPSCIRYKKTRTAKKLSEFFWCGRRDLNPHGLPQEPETCASANFATSAYEDSQKTVFLSSPEEASRRKTFPPADMLFTGSPLCISRAALFSNPQAHHLLYSTISSKSSVLSS